MVSSINQIFVYVQLITKILWLTMCIVFPYIQVHSLSLGLTRLEASHTNNCHTHQSALESVDEQGLICINPYLLLFQIDEYHFQYLICRGEASP